MVKRSVFSVLIIFILILSSHSLVLGIEESNNNLMYNNNYILEKNEDIIEKGNYEILTYIDTKLDKEKVESKILGTIKI